MADRTRPHLMAAYGGGSWSPRTQSLSEELGQLWAACGSNSEYGKLKSVLMHRPGTELTRSSDPDAVQMIEPLDLKRAQQQHDSIANAYRRNDVTLHYIEPAGEPTPNQMFAADLMFATPEGVILARPASTVRAGEERNVARRLADLGVPIVRSIGGNGTFEGADAMWLTPKHLILGRGLRTNDAAVRQIISLMDHMGVEVTVVDLPFGTMHLMGMLRIADRDLAIAWPTRLAHRGVEALKREGYQVVFLPDLEEAINCSAFNFVTLGPREILTAADTPRTTAFYEDLGIFVHLVHTDELGKAAGNIGCLTGVLHRESV
jgi:N-dimethylarginine dimethylaminohydrolase